MLERFAACDRIMRTQRFLKAARVALFMGLGGLVFSLVQPAQTFAKPVPVVTDIRVGQIDGATRLVLDISKSVTYKVFLLANPNRVVIDLPAVGWRLPQRPLPKNIGILGKLRYGLFQPGTTRVVVDVRQPVKISDALLLAPADQHSYRIVLDLKAVSAQMFSRHVSKPALVVAAREGDSATSSERQVWQNRSGMLVPPSRSASNTRSEGRSAVRSQNGSVAHSPFQLPPRKPKYVKRRKHIIVLDPGHGGADPGAVSLKGIYEKHITLAAAREFKAQLEKTGRYKVLLTRTRDVFVKLRERVEFARDAKADIFISLHADKIRNPRIRGLSVHTLSEKASDREAAELAERENKVDLIVGVDLSNESKDVTNILIDLAQRETMNQSARFATLLVRELKRETKLLRNTHRFAGFAVLKAPDVPSVLLEMGFLSNRYDERNLRRKAYRAKLAKSVVRAVDRYFSRIEEAKR